MGVTWRLLLAALMVEDLGSHALRRPADEADAPGSSLSVDPEAFANGAHPLSRLTPGAGRGPSALVESEARADATFPVSRLAPLLLPSDGHAPGAGSFRGGALHLPVTGLLPSAAGAHSHGALSGGVGPLRAVDMLEKPDDDDDEEKAATSRPPLESEAGSIGAGEVSVGTGGSPDGSEQSKADEGAMRVDLTSVEAFDPISMDPVPVSLPTVWVDNLNLNQLYRVYGDWSSSMFTATAKHSLALKMRIEVVSSKDPGTQRGLRVIQRLQSWKSSGLISGGNIVSVFGTQTASDLTYILYEGELMTLDRLLSDKVFGLFDHLVAESDSWKPAMPLSLSVPLIEDLLRGAKDLETADIIHANISPFTVMIVDKLRGAITGLNYVCIDDDSNKFGKPSLKETTESNSASPLWQPPESKYGVPQDRSTHVWSIGMIFATMCFGSNPAEALVRKVRPAGVPDMYFPESRQEVREILAEKFDITKTEDFENIGEDLQEIFEGMLHIDPAQRWSTKLAIAKIKVLAARRRIRLPQPRFRPFLPREWTNLAAISGPAPYSSTSSQHVGEDGVEQPFSFAGIKDTGVLYESDGDEWQ